ncbi:MAG: PEP/pyruvate-binding domain-containing protein [Candidatus Cloacimonetes bacterium]|nr:PEP/pyruvate-binding domain-containing protein [Candidatus Cloacimonadota bacterium]
MNNAGNQRKYSRDHRNSIFNYLGKGELGGKAAGLMQIQKILENENLHSDINEITVSIPGMTVILTEVFDQFMKQNDLYPIALSSSDDVFIAHSFQKASLPPAIVGDLRDLITKAENPLAVRSSSLLEDSSSEPFAGVYATKMLPNNQPDIETRFHKLTEAIKFIYSSLFFSESRDYFRSIGRKVEEEKMAVIIQDVVGNHYGEDFYPLISGVGRTYNYYPVQDSKREDGVINLALGLGKTIVDGGSAWIYSPLSPQSPPPCNSNKSMLDNSQREFWSIKMEVIKEFNPISEMEFMRKQSIEKAEDDGVLSLLCSTYDYQNDRFISGIQEKGARLLDFSPILKYKKIALNDILKKLLHICREQYQADVEIEFALEKITAETSGESVYHLGFLQVRTMQTLADNGNLSQLEYLPSALLAESSSVLGNGRRDDIYDVVFVKPDTFSAINSRTIAREIAEINRELTTEHRPYLLIGFGRWGSSDPWLGIPVTWSMISGAKAIIEATLPQMKPDLSQGSHFFHNLIAFGIFYLSIQEDKKKTIDWNWLNEQKIIRETDHVCLVRCSRNMEVIVDCVANRGVIVK